MGTQARSYHQTGTEIPLRSRVCPHTTSNSRSRSAAFFFSPSPPALCRPPQQSRFRCIRRTASLDGRSAPCDLSSLIVAKKHILGKPYCVKSTFFFIHSLVFYNIFHKRFLYKPELSVASRGGKYHISLPGCPRQRQRSGKPKSLWYNNFQIFTCKRAVIQSSAVESLVPSYSSQYQPPGAIRFRLRLCTAAQVSGGQRAQGVTANSQHR